MAFKMKGSPAKLGNIQGTTSYQSALKMVSPLKQMQVADELENVSEENLTVIAKDLNISITDIDQSVIDSWNAEYKKMQDNPDAYDFKPRRVKGYKGAYDDKGFPIE